MHLAPGGGCGRALRNSPEKVRRGEESLGLAHTNWVHGNARNPSTKEGGEWKRRAVDGQSLNSFIFNFNFETYGVHLFLGLSRVLYSM